MERAIRHAATCRRIGGGERLGGGEDRRRTGEEALFRDWKSLGWQWPHSRVQDPERVQRLLLLLLLLLLLALATWWMLAGGPRLLRHGGRRAVEGGRRCSSHFQLGGRCCEQQLDAHRSVPWLLRLWPEPAPSRKLS